MRGIVRPCRHSLGPDLHAQWESHLCGLCLTLRDEWGQSARMLTGYDILLLSVLVEAQTGRAETVHAGRCPLRGMRTAEVVPSTNPGARLAAAAGLLAGAATIEDKLHDGDLPGWSSPVGLRWSRHALSHGQAMAGECGLQSDVVTQVATLAAAAERPEADLATLLAPTGAAISALFAHTAVVAGVPANTAPLARAGDAFGRLVHLLDAVADFGDDAKRGSFNPLAATGTTMLEARELGVELAAIVRASLDDAVLAEPELARRLLGPVLDRSVKHSFPHATGSVALAAVALPFLSLGWFGRRGSNSGFPSDNEIRARRCGGCCEGCACACCEFEACNCCFDSCG